MHITWLRTEVGSNMKFLSKIQWKSLHKSERRLISWILHKNNFARLMRTWRDHTSSLRTASQNAPRDAGAYLKAIKLAIQNAHTRLSNTRRAVQCRLQLARSLSRRMTVAKGEITPVIASQRKRRIARATVRAFLMAYEQRNIRTNSDIATC